MENYQELLLANEELAIQSKLYQPSSFWEKASIELTNDIIKYGIENFRQIDRSLFFFVPTHGSPGNSFTKELSDELTAWLLNTPKSTLKNRLALDNFLSGKLAALSDYRVFLAADKPDKLPYLHKFSESNFGNPVEQFEFENKKYSRSSLNYLLGLALLKKHLGDEVPKTILEIGGGFGTLGEIFYHAGIHNHCYIDIDIPPISYVAEKYLKQIYGRENVATYSQTRADTIISIDKLPPASVFCSWQIENLQGCIDLFVNFISFQEMEPNIVENYFTHVQRLNPKWILLRNLKEGKQIKKSDDDVGVEKPVLSEDYLRMIPNYELIERNTFPFGYRTVDNFNSEILLFRKK